MKINWNERDKTKAVYSIIVVFVSIMFYFFIYRFINKKISPIHTYRGIFFKSRWNTLNPDFVVGIVTRWNDTS